MRNSLVNAALLLLAVLASSSVDSRAAQAQMPDRVKRGEYLATIMDCTGCHTTGALAGKPDPKQHLAGSDIGFELPTLGIFYPPNLTSDPETGLGRWSEAEIVTAVRTGVTPTGRMLAPVMPFNSYARLNTADAQALAAYLKSLKPVRHQVPAPTGPSEKPVAPYLKLVMPE